MCQRKQTLRAVPVVLDVLVLLAFSAQLQDLRQARGDWGEATTCTAGQQSWLPERPLARPHRPCLVLPSGTYSRHLLALAGRESCPHRCGAVDPRDQGVANSADGEPPELRPHWGAPTHLCASLSCSPFFCLDAGLFTFCPRKLKNPTRKPQSTNCIYPRVHKHTGRKYQ